MQNTMNPEEKFKTDLLRRYKKDMHLKFFNEDASRQYVKIPIFSKLSPKKQLIPFRNTECQKSSCVYDIQDIVDKFKDSQMSSMSGFICYSCNKFVELQKFFLDIALKKIIDHIWERFNKIDKIICNGVTVMRDGHWEPNLPEYLSMNMSYLLT